MYRKHYNSIAAALRSGNASMNAIYSIADALVADNAKFDRERFINKALEGPTMEQRTKLYIRTHKRYALNALSLSPGGASAP